MKIELLDKQTVKIILNSLDMDKFAITYEQMDYDSPQTRQIIMELLKKVKHETSIDLSKGKLFIEAFPYNNNGCILYINVLKDTVRTLDKPIKNINSLCIPIIFQYKNIDLLANACSNLFTHYSHLILKSSLYLMEEETYSLIIHSYFKLDDKINAIASEYGTLQGKGAIQSAFVEEHGKLLIKDNAIETIVEYIN